MPQADEHQKVVDTWHNEESFGTVLLILLLDHFGPEAAQWTPDTIAMELHDELGVQLDPDALSRLMAALQICTSDEFYKVLPTFNEFCIILSGGAHVPGIFTPADAKACAWGITEAFLLSPPDEDEPFTEEIRAYIGHACQQEGIIRPPDVLRIAIHDENLLGKLQTNFADDPEMYSAIDHAEQERTNEIRAFVKNRLILMAHTISELPLKQGDVGDIAKKMLAALSAEIVNE